MSASSLPAKAGSPPISHYSYEHYADPGTASGFDRLRFGGPIGELLADAQQHVLLRFTGDLSGCKVIDVGTGTGRAALALAAEGAEVTGVDASPAMLAVAHQRSAERALPVSWVLADAHRLAFPDRAFDVAVSLRVLMHTPDWRRCLAELCRVAEARVIIDYPAMASVAALQALGRRIRATLFHRVEAYRVFRRRVIERELAAHGFRIDAVHQQFVLPIALHKAIGSVRFTRAIEGLLARVGLLRVCGSPVTVVAVRWE